jgi:hypothetical protein
MGGHLYALDFDGVLCDSCGESSLSAVKVLLLSLSCFSSACGSSGYLQTNWVLPANQVSRALADQRSLLVFGKETEGHKITGHFPKHDLVISFSLPRTVSRAAVARTP